MSGEGESGVFDEVVSTGPHEVAAQECTRDQQECMVAGQLRARTAPVQLEDGLGVDDEPRPKPSTAPQRTPQCSAGDSETDEPPSFTTSPPPKPEKGAAGCGGRGLLDSESGDNTIENQKNNASDGGPMREDLVRQSSVASSLSSSGSFSLRIKTPAGTEVDLTLEGSHSGETVKKFSCDATSVALAALNLETPQPSLQSLSAITEQKEPNKPIPNPTDSIRKNNSELNKQE